MKDMTFAGKEINFAALDAQLREALGDTVYGVSISPDMLTVHLADSASDNQLSQVEALVEAHDPSVLTPQQEAERVYQEHVEALRQENSQTLDLTEFDGTDTALRSLAQKVAWLELEVAGLLGNASA